MKLPTHFCKRLAAASAILLMGVGTIALGFTAATLIDSLTGSGLGVMAGLAISAAAWEKLSPLRNSLVEYVKNGEWTPPMSKEVKPHKDSSPTWMTVSNTFKKISSMKPSEFCKRVAAASAVLLMSVGTMAVGIGVAVAIDSIGGSGLGAFLGLAASGAIWDKLSPHKERLMNYVKTGAWKPVENQREEGIEMMPIQKK